MPSRKEDRSRRSDAVHSVVKPQEYLQLLGEVQLDRDSVDRLVMNFLEVSGHEDAAKKFCEESGIARGVEGDWMKVRTDLRALLLIGDITAAWGLMGEVCPELLKDKDIAFSLRFQTLLEHIRNDTASAALDYARDHLASPDLSEAQLDLLEQGLALLAFEDPYSCAYAPLLLQAQRADTSATVDRALLEANNQAATPTLLSVLQLKQFMEDSMERVSYVKSGGGEVEKLYIFFCRFPKITSVAQPPFGPL